MAHRTAVETASMAEVDSMERRSGAVAFTVEAEAFMAVDIPSVEGVSTVEEGSTEAAAFMAEAEASTVEVADMAAVDIIANR